MPKLRKYRMPDFLTSVLTQDAYCKWLHRRAVAHVKRDRKRGNTTATNESYKLAIHAAVISSEGRDWYTGEQLDWSLASRYSNTDSQTQRRKYKATLALLPTIDHVSDGLGDADFKVCAWRTNDAKSDLNCAEFVALCRRVVAHFDNTDAFGVSRCPVIGEGDHLNELTRSPAQG